MTAQTTAGFLKHLKEAIPPLAVQAIDPTITLKPSSHRQILDDPPDWLPIARSQSIIWQACAELPRPVDLMERHTDPKTLLPILSALPSHHRLYASTSPVVDRALSIQVLASLDASHQRLVLRVEDDSGRGKTIPSQLLLKDMLVSWQSDCVVALRHKSPAKDSVHRVYITAMSKTQADNWYLALKQLSVGAWE